jgi:hypothetical protein
LVGGLTIATHAHVTRGNTSDRPFVVIKNFCRSKTREYFDAEGFGLLTHPAGDAAQTDDIVAVVLKTLGKQPVRRFL